MLQIFVESVKPGKGAAHQKVEVGWPAAFRKAKWPSHYLAMTSMSGPGEAWFLAGYDSYAALETDQKNVEKTPTLSRELDRLSQVDGELLSGTRNILAAYRPDLSYRPDVDIAQMRYGADCAVGQSGHVFFLVGILNVSGTAERTECVVPTGAMLFFPVVNTICTNEPPPLTPTEQLRPCAAGPIETATDLLVEIDRVPVGGLGRFRAQSDLFGLTLPPDNLLGGLAGSCHFDGDVSACVPYLAAADGFYLMLPPLPPGEPALHIHGVMPAFGGFTLDVTYDPLIVVPRGGMS